MKTKVRRIIDKWVDQKQPWERKPIYIGEGSVFMFPSASLDRTSGYPVAWVRRTLPSGKIVDEFLCGCLGFWFSTEDSCRHIKALQTQIASGKEKMLA